ncbi:RPM1-interacting protein 4-like [Oryza brachyantha]|uniref:RPM1-interacting protein 4-like n=1 Tax=Oryza brachyantha TaxID=4533 RepID=UPI001ADBE698|nr:RPM1-interacting protein 4-like [Oryza brachyantha]
MAAGQGPVVPKFGSWDAENIGYTVFFDKVRENKTAPTPAPAPAPKAAAHDGYEFDPYEHYENLSRNVPSRPPSSHHHRQAPPPQQQQHHYPASQRSGGNGYHRRTGSNGSSAASEASSRGSKFSPPRPYQPRYSNNGYPAAQQAAAGGGGGYGYGYGPGAGAYDAPPQMHHHHHHHHQHAAPPKVAASPPRHAPPPPVSRATAKAPSAVPKFGVWDEQNAAAAGQGFTVQFEKVKRHREVAKAAAAAPDVTPRMSPELAAPARHHPRRKAKRSFLSKVYRCMFPRVRE